MPGLCGAACNQWVLMCWRLCCGLAGAQEEGQQTVTMEDVAYEKALDSMAMVAGHMPLPLFRALLTWRERRAWALPHPAPCLS